MEEPRGRPGYASGGRVLVVAIGGSDLRSLGRILKSQARDAEYLI